MSQSTLLLLVFTSCAGAWTAASARQPALAVQRPAACQHLRRLRMADDDEGFTFGDPDVSTETMQMVVEEEELTEKQKEIARLRAAEKFMKKDTGDAVCRVCGYKFKMEEGERLVPRMTPFQLLPDSYVCPN